MSYSDEFAFLDATAQAELVRRKELKPIELVDAAIERIERLNPSLNAVVTPMYDEARKRATAPLPEGSFAGVPFLLKDLVAFYGGVRMTLGADGARVARLFLVRAGRILGLGLVVGVGGAFAATTVTRTLAYGISPLNPLYMVVAGGVMVLVALAATMVPVVKAARVDPLKALQRE